MYSVLLESDRRLGAQPLSESADARAPFPVPPGSRPVLHGYLLAQGAAVLPLPERVDVGPCEVLVHVHLVAQILESCHIAHHGALPVVLGLEAKVQQVALVAVGAVEVCLSDVLGELGIEVVFGLHALQPVGEGSLSAVLVVGVEVQPHHIGRLGHQAEACACIIVPVGLLASVSVGEEAFGVRVAKASREAQAAGDAVVVRCAGSCSAMRSRLQRDVRSLIVQRVLGVYAYQPAHRVASVERALRTPHDVDALHIAQVKVKRTLVHPGYVVHIEPNCRRVDAASHPAHINSGGLPAAV